MLLESKEWVALKKQIFIAILINGSSIERMQVRNF